MSARWVSGWVVIAALAVRGAIEVMSAGAGLGGPALFRTAPGGILAVTGVAVPAALIRARWLERHRSRPMRVGRSTLLALLVLVGLSALAGASIPWPLLLAVPIASSAALELNRTQMDAAAALLFGAWMLPCLLGSKLAAYSAISPDGGLSSCVSFAENAGMEWTGGVALASAGVALVLAMWRGRR